jgi:hypothetical protein
MLEDLATREDGLKVEIVWEGNGRIQRGFVEEGVGE